MSDPIDNNDDSAIPEDSVSREFIDPNNVLQINVKKVGRPKKVKKLISV